MLACLNSEEKKIVSILYTTKYEKGNITCIQKVTVKSMNEKTV